MAAVSQICDAHLTDNFELGTNFTDNRIYEVLKEIAPNFTDTMFFCKWRNTPSYCQSYFEPILTEEGVCFTFNDLRLQDIYTEE